LRCDSCAGIENYIVHRSGAAGKIALMPFIEAGDNRSPQHSDAGPSPTPTCISQCRQSFAPGTEEQDAQQAVAEDVPSLADEEVPLFELRAIDMKNEVQQRVEKAACIVSGEIRGRFNGDDD